jgi:hypothetical protein
VYLLAQTILFRQIASWSKTEPARARPIVALFFAAAIASAILDGAFFFCASARDDARHRPTHPFRTARFPHHRGPGPGRVSEQGKPSCFRAV